MVRVLNGFNNNQDKVWILTLLLIVVKFFQPILKDRV